MPSEDDLTSVGGPDSVTDEDIDPKSVTTDQEFTRSRAVAAVVHTDGSTVYADGRTSELASGDLGTPSDVQTVLQAAMDEAKTQDDGARVYIQTYNAGTYTVDDLVNVYNYTTVAGSDREHGTIVERSDAGTADSGVFRLTSDNGSNIRGVEIRDLRLEGAGTGASTTIHGIDTDGNKPYSNRVHNVYFEGLSGDAMQLPDGQGFSNTFSNISMENVSGWGFVGHSGVGTVFRDWMWPVKPSTGVIWGKEGLALVEGMNVGNMTTGFRFGDSANTRSCAVSFRDINIESIPPGGTGIKVEQSSRIGYLSNVQITVDGNLSGSGTTTALDIIARNNKVVPLFGVEFKSKNGASFDEEVVGGINDTGGVIDFFGSGSRRGGDSDALGNYVAVRAMKAGFEAAYLNLDTGGGGLGIDGNQVLASNSNGDTEVPSHLGLTDTNRQTLSGNLTLSATDAMVQNIDPGGSGRDVTLPAESNGLGFIIGNRADAAETLTVKDNSGTTIATVNQDGVGYFWSDGTGWLGFAAAGGVT